MSTYPQRSSPAERLVGLPGNKGYQRSEQLRHYLTQRPAILLPTNNPPGPLGATDRYGWQSRQEAKAPYREGLAHLRGGSEPVQASMKAALRWVGV